MKLLRLVLFASAAVVPLLFTTLYAGGASSETAAVVYEGGAAPVTSERVNELALRGVGPAYSSGRISCITFDPRDSNVWYVTAAAGGLWKTTDGGTSFKCLTDNLSSFSMGHVALDPKNPDIVWLGSGEQQSQRSVDFGDGIYRSADGGRTWKNMGLTRTEHIARIHIDPRNTNVIYVAAPGPLWNSGGERGVYKTTDGGKTWKQSLNISENTGVVDLVMDPSNPDVLYAASFQRRRHTGVAISGGPESGIYKTKDGGASWEKLTKGLPTEPMGRIALAISPQNPDIVYAELGANGGQGGFYRTNDAGASWARVSNQASGANMYYGDIFADPHKEGRVYVTATSLQVTDDHGKTFKGVSMKGVHVDHHAMAFDPKDANHVLLGNDGGLYESKDGTKSWRHFQAITATQFYRICTDNSVPFYKVLGGTQDNGTQSVLSRTMNSVGIRMADARKVSGGDGFQARVDPEDPKIVYSSSQNGALLRNGKSIRPGGKGGPGAGGKGKGGKDKGGKDAAGKDKDAAGKDVAGKDKDAAGKDKDAVKDQGKGGKDKGGFGGKDKGGFGGKDKGGFGGKDKGGFGGKDKGGFGGKDKGGKDKGGGFGGKGGKGGGAGGAWNWDTPFIISPHSNKRVYTVSNQLFRSDDRGDTWKAISPNLTRQHDRNKIEIMGKIWGPEAVGRNQSTTPLNVGNALNESPLVEGLIYVGSNDGVLAVTEDGGTTWRKIDQFPGVPMLATVSDVYPSHHEPDTVYASFIYYEYGDYRPYLLKSTDRGKSWTSVAGNLPPRDFVWSVVEDPVNKNLLFAGTEFGLYFTLDGGKQWVQLKGGVPTAAFRDLEIQLREGDLVGGTFGRGFFILDDITPLRHATPDNLAKEGVLFPPRRTYVYEEKTDVKPAANTSDLPNPPVGALISYHLRDSLPADAKIVLTVTDWNGQPLRLLLGPVTAGFHRLSWNLRPDSGGLVRPGKYKVSMSKLVKGALTPLGEPREFEVTPPLGGALKGEELSEEASWLRLERPTTNAPAAVEGGSRSR